MFDFFCFLVFTIFRCSGERMHKLEESSSEIKVVVDRYVESA